MEDKNLHKEHRERMKKRFLKNKGDGFAQHELLEMTLYTMLPRVDTNKTAHRLIERFGSLHDMLYDGSYDEFRKIKGVGEKTAYQLSVMCELFRSAECPKKQRIYLKNCKDYKKYFFNELKQETEEVLLFVCLAEDGRIIRKETLSRGGTEHVNISFYELGRFVIGADSKHVVMAHNHPNSIACPSMEDICATQRINEFLQGIEISLLDHVIVGRENTYSMQEHHEL